MPNILLTDFCNRSCPYCFAKQQVELGTEQKRWEMPIAEYDTILSYLRPGLDTVSLLGGEPTLHSDFMHLIRRACEQGFQIKLFSNGTTKALLDLFDSPYRDQVRVILNLNAPEFYRADEWERINACCRAGAGKVSLSYNLYQVDFRWDFIRDAILEHNLAPRVRLGITQPISGAQNTFIQESEMAVINRRIVEMAEELAGSGIYLGFDCGFRQCGFTKEQLGTLAECGAQLMFSCRPILDIGPGLKVWRCFPLSTDVAEELVLTDFTSLQAMVDYFHNRWSEVQSRGNTPRCTSCLQYEIGTCHGGCLSRTLLRLGEVA